MKKSPHVGLTGLLLISCSSFSAVPTEGWYAGLMGTLSYAPSVTSNINHPVPVPLASGGPTFIFHPFIRDARFTYGLGGGGGGQIGYRLCNFRFEGELLFDYNPYSKIAINNFIFKRHYVPLSTIFNPLLTPLTTRDVGIKMGGNTTFGAGLINAYYEIYNEDNDPSFIPYLGLGIGYAYLQNQLNFTIQRPMIGTSGVIINTINYKENNSSPIGQLILGLSYFYNDDTSLSADYRYLASKPIQKLDARVQVHTVNFSLNYTFSER